MEYVYSDCRYILSTILCTECHSVHGRAERILRQILYTYYRCTGVNWWDSVSSVYTFRPVLFYSSCITLQCNWQASLPLDIYIVTIWLFCIIDTCTLYYTRCIIKKTRYCLIGFLRYVWSMSFGYAHNDRHGLAEFVMQLHNMHDMLSFSNETLWLSDIAILCSIRDLVYAHAKPLPHRVNIAYYAAPCVSICTVYEQYMIDHNFPSSLHIVLICTSTPQNISSSFIILLVTLLVPHSFAVFIVTTPIAYCSAKPRSLIYSLSWVNLAYSTGHLNSDYFLENSTSSVEEYFPRYLRCILLWTPRAPAVRLWAQLRSTKPTFIHFSFLSCPQWTWSEQRVQTLAASFGPRKQARHSSVIRKSQNNFHTPEMYTLSISSFQPRASVYVYISQWNFIFSRTVYPSINQFISLSIARHCLVW